MCCHWVPPFPSQNLCGEYLIPRYWFYGTCTYPHIRNQCHSHRKYTCATGSRQEPCPVVVLCVLDPRVSDPILLPALWVSACQTKCQESISTSTSSFGQRKKENRKTLAVWPLKIPYIIASSRVSSMWWRSNLAARTAQRLYHCAFSGPKDIAPHPSSTLTATCRWKSLLTEPVQKD